MKNINEGLRRYDLEDVVLPIISVDEFESKVSDNAIVFGFYATDKEAAEDLNRFIQKSPVVLLDTEVSPAPTQEGYYMVFVEIMNDDRLENILKNVIEDVSQLTNIEKWKMQINHVKNLIPVTDENIKKLVKRKRNVKEIFDFIKNSCLLEANIEDNILTIKNYNQTLCFEIIDFGPVHRVYPKYKLHEAKLNFGMRNAAKDRFIAQVLGEGWVVSQTDNYVILQRMDENNILLLSLT